MSLPRTIKRVTYFGAAVVVAGTLLLDAASCSREKARDKYSSTQCESDLKRAGAGEDVSDLCESSCQRNKFYRLFHLEDVDHKAAARLAKEECNQGINELLEYRLKQEGY